MMIETLRKRVPSWAERVSEATKEPPELAPKATNPRRHSRSVILCKAVTIYSHLPFLPCLSVTFSSLQTISHSIE